MMPKVKKVRPLENYRLEVEFEDGSYGVVDIKESLYGPGFFQKSRDRRIRCYLLAKWR